MAVRRALTFLCACLCLWAGNARADEAADKAEAERLFTAGVSLQKTEDFERAIAAFEASLRLYPTKSALFNLANCLQATHRYPEALQILERLETDYGAELEESMRGRAAIQRAELENLTAWLTIEVEPAGAEVRVDGEPMGKAPLHGPVRLSIGDHEIEISLSGYESERRSVNLAPRERAGQTFALQPEREQVSPPATPAPTSPTRPTDAGPQRSDGSLTRVAGWGLLGTGGALLVGGTATGIYALSLDRKLSDGCYEEHCHTSKKGDVDRLDRMTSTTNLLLGLGVASATAGVVLLLLDDGSEDHDPTTSAGISVAPGYVGAGVRGAF